MSSIFAWAPRTFRFWAKSANCAGGTAVAATPRKLSRLCRSPRRGASAVEFAVVAPVFFLIIFSLIEFGRVVMVQQFITNATREGARVGVLDGSTTSEVNAAVNAYLSTGRISGSTITVTPNPPSTAVYGAPVTVTVSVPFSQVSWLPSPMFLGGKTLSASSVMRREAVQ